MRVCFYTLGCKVNLNETGALEQLFRANGFTIAQEGEAADVFIVNSCTVTNFGDQKSRKWLRRKKRENPGAVTVLTGCYPQAFPEEAAQFMEADLVCGNGDRKAILENVQKLLDGHERIVAIAPHQRGEQLVVAETFAARALEVVEQLRQPAERFLPVLRSNAGRVAQRDRQLRQDALAQLDALRLPQGRSAALQQTSALFRRERQAEAFRHGVPAQQRRLGPLRGQRAE